LLWGGAREEPRILFDGWGEIDLDPGADEPLLQIPPDTLDIIDTRYGLYETRAATLPSGFRERLRGCLSFAQSGWCLRHYELAIEAPGPLLSPLARLQRRLDMLSSGLPIVSCWSEGRELAALAPENAPLEHVASLKDAVEVAIGLVRADPAGERRHARTGFLRSLWEAYGLRSRLLQIAAALGTSLPQSLTKRVAVVDAESLAAPQQSALGDILVGWGVQHLFCTGATTEFSARFPHHGHEQRYAGALSRAIYERDSELILLDVGRKVENDWLSKLQIAKNALSTGAAVLIPSEDGNSQELALRAFAGQDLRTRNVRPLAMLIDAPALPPNLRDPDLAQILAKLARERPTATLTFVAESDFPSSHSA
jgi:hypothetical protein